MDVKDKDENHEDSKDESKVKPKSKGIIRTLLMRFTQIWPLKYVFKILKKIIFFGRSEKVETICAADQASPPGRRVLSGKKRIGRLTRIILYFAPHRLQCALGYNAEGIGQATGSDDVRKSPLKPSGKGSKRKQDDVDLEEQHSWVTFMSEDLPDEDQPDDPTYEPSKSSGTDSEEEHSKNDTESDLETEERDGIVMLKESAEKEKKEECPSKEEQTNADEHCNGEQNQDSDSPKKDPNPAE
ncbi:uncharacterized protein LOC134610334 [Pelobates fuscus]|uniref:uncharacterized protein LOC134610334 n=1 Tax=Pelobates fuscus TaxID=191477 RepID=UPI002FE496A4